MKHTTTHLVYALALVPGRRRMAARLGGEPRRWSFAAFPFAVLGIQVICMAVIRRLHGRTLTEAL